MARILHVEDSEVQRRLLTHILKSHGHEVVEAEDGQAAFELLEQDRKFDIVLSDYEMPRMNGVDLFKAIKSRSPQMLLILQTSGSNRDARAMCEQEGWLFHYKMLDSDMNYRILQDLITRACAKRG